MEAKENGIGYEELRKRFDEGDDPHCITFKKDPENKEMSLRDQNDKHMAEEAERNKDNRIRLVN